MYDTKQLKLNIIGGWRNMLWLSSRHIHRQFLLMRIGEWIHTYNPQNPFKNLQNNLKANVGIHAYFDSIRRNTTKKHFSRDLERKREISVYFE